MQEKEDGFKYQTEQFADIRILRYRVPGFEELSPGQKELVYYLYQASLSGRDITWDQNYKHNLRIRRTLENIVNTYSGDRQSGEFGKFMVYTKRVWYSNGIHHDYSTWKMIPEFSKEYFKELAARSDAAGFPLGEGETVDQLVARLTPIMFDPELDAKRVNLDPQADLIKDSANNFYEGVTKEEAEAFYAKIIDPKDPRPVSYGLNSKLVKENGKLEEVVWKVGGMYTQAIERVVYWLEKALTVAEDPLQRAALEKLVAYYRSGELRDFDEYSIKWVADTESMIDCINGFIEVYGDAMGFRATYESMVYFKDLEATRRVEAIANAAQWFEDHSPILDQHKRENVKGVSARVITEVAGTGAVSPPSPTGINLPNASWIRKEYGSKSVTIGNIIHSYNEARKESGEDVEFISRSDDLELDRKYGNLADALETDLHEVVGHGSGQLELGTGTPKETLKNYASTLEEARADLVALYYLPDPKLVEIGVAPTVDVGRSSYNSYITNGLLTQLRRIVPGQDIEESHMRDRQMIAKWVYEKGAPGKVIEKVTRDGKTFFVVNNYQRLRELFGELLREVQRIKSQGDYVAGRHLVETYGVKVDRELNEEVAERYRKLGIAPYSGFINPVLTPVTEGGRIVDVKIEYPEDFTGQMLYYAKEYSFLPTYN
ncbi:MAG TPA: dihydrofolate reductase [archaeon]|nr:dihydrofolate reductase [archaeon]